MKTSTSHSWGTTLQGQGSTLQVWAVNAWIIYGFTCNNGFVW